MTTFGSCTFLVTVSTFPLPGPQVGDRFTVNPCQYNVETQDLEATGKATSVHILLKLGLTPSAAQQAQVSIDSATGGVVVNKINTGQSVTLQAVTGSTGSSGG